MPPQGDPNSEASAGKSASASDPNQTTSRANLIGKTLGGRYTIERELGRGGIGAVYLARDKPELHSRPVVVKVLLEEAMKDEFVVSKFYQEIESLTRLDTVPADRLSEHLTCARASVVRNKVEVA